jgi:Flp pilus assembly protein TadG
LKLGRNRRGTSLVELSFLVPLVVYLFIGTLDMAFYCYGLITVQSAARVACLYTSSSSLTWTDETGACTRALAEMKDLPNVGSSINACNANPVTVTASTTTGAGLTEASVVSVTYQSPALIPIPGVLPNQFSWTRTVKMASRN